MKRLLLICTIVSAGCSPAGPGAGKIARDAAEHRQLVSAMQQHPALAGGQPSAAQGKPLVLDKTVRPRPDGVAPATHHAPSEPHRH